MHDNHDPLHELVHLYIDGAISRRGLVKRVARHTGSVTAAVAALAGFEELQGQTVSACPPDVRVPMDAAGIVAQDVVFAGEDGARLFAHLAYPAGWRDAMPGVLVVHENRGLVEHIKDVTRRVAKAGFVGLAVDLLSRQGGVQNFPDATAQTAAYNRTTQFERRSDLISALSYLKALPQTQHDRIGMTGFCAGGANTWDFAVNVPELKAAVPFYGAPPAGDDFARIESAVLAIYAERDRALTQRMLTAANEMITRQKRFGMVVYEGVGHAFHNDTGPNYNAEAACDAWARAMAWFRKFL
jgi:carboxymethylenebutenolidase